MRLNRSAEAHDGGPAVLLAPTVAPAPVPVLVEAKVRRPGPPTAFVPRGRVDALLARATAGPLTLVVAPAGHGRTVALAAWADAAPAAVAWLRLDGRDVDPRRLVAHLLAAIARVAPSATITAERSLWLGEDVHARVVPLLVAGLSRATAGGPPLTLVLDDAQLLPAGGWAPIATLLADAPGGLRIVVSGRERPALPVTRRRAAGVVATLGPEELAFDDDETRRLVARNVALAAAGSRPDGRPGAGGDDDARVRAVRDLGGRWAAALALAAAALARSPGRRTATEAREDAESAIDAYVAEEVVDAADQGLGVFLLVSSVLERLDGDLCAAVLDEAAAPALLARAHAAGLVVRGTGGVARHRTPLRPALRRTLEARDPALALRVHARASAVLESEGRVGAAVAHALAAGDPVRARALSEAHLARLGGRPGTVPTGASWPWTTDAAPPAPDGGGSEAADDAAPAVRDAAAAIRGQTRWLAGDPAGARAALEPCVGGMTHPAPRCWSLATLALAVAADDPRRAVLLARHARRIAGRPGATWLEQALAHQALADALRRDGTPVDAREALVRAAATTGGAPATLHHVLTLVLEAEIALDAGDRATVEGAATAARRLLDPLARGVVPMRLAAVESAAGRGADDLQGSTPTAAELRLLALLPSGLTRREIGNELFVSVDTVKTHLRRLYRRLGVETRAEAVAVARVRGLLPADGTPTRR